MIDVSLVLGKCCFLYFFKIMQECILFVYVPISEIYIMALDAYN